MYHVTKTKLIRHPSIKSVLVSTSCPWRQGSLPKPQYGPREVRRTALLNGITVAAAKPLGAAIGSCTVMFQAGTRFESDDCIGATHFIRACSPAGGCGYTSFAKSRVLQQAGAAVTCSADRQTVAFTLRCPPPLFSELKHYLLDIAARCCFNDWEVEDRRQMVREDHVRIHPRDRVMDLIQIASWTGPLANSTYCPEGRIDAIDQNILNCYTGSQYKTDETSIASVGMPFEETIRLAEMLQFKPDRPPPRYIPASRARAGFELCDLGAASDTWVALAVPGCGTCADLECLVKHAVIVEACGTEAVCRGQHIADRWSGGAVSALPADVGTEYRAFNISYRDTGLFGILVRARSCVAWGATVAAAQFLADVGQLTREQIDIGRKKLKLKLALHEEDCVRHSENLALQLANNVALDSARDAADLIDCLCVDDICCTAQILADKCNLMSMAVVGDVGAVPHDMELLQGRK